MKSFKEFTELEEALTAHDKKDIEAIKGAIKRLQNELTNPNPNLDRNNINQRIATEKKRLVLYGIKEEVELDEALITFGGKAYPKFGQVVIQAGGAGCFAGDTLVKTQEGYKQIKDITTEDVVASFNEETKIVGYNQVKTLFKYEVPSSPLVELEFDNGQKIICTDNHKFYIEGEWVEAKDLLI